MCTYLCISRWEEGPVNKRTHTHTTSFPWMQGCTCWAKKEPETERKNDKKNEKSIERLINVKQEQTERETEGQTGEATVRLSDACTSNPSQHTHSRMCGNFWRNKWNGIQKLLQHRNTTNEYASQQKDRQTSGRTHTHTHL